MDAEDCRTLSEVRAEIDRIDRELLALISERSSYVRRAAQLKSSREAVVDPARIAEIVAELRRRSGALGLSPDVVEEAFRALIDRFIAYEQAEFDRRHGK